MIIIHDYANLRGDESGFFLRGRAIINSSGDTVDGIWAYNICIHLIEFWKQAHLF